MACFHSIKEVVSRELGLIRKHPVCVSATIGTMTFCMIFFLTFFKEGMPHDLPIGVVDSDRSSLSRNIVRQIDATQIGKTVSFDSYRQAREALQKGEINGFCVIPPGMYNDVLSGKQPVMTFYVNSLYFVGGALAYKDLLTMMNLTAGGVQRELLLAKGMDIQTMTGLIQPIAIDTHQIGNTGTDYGVYLTNVLLPGMLELTVILATVFAIGSELKNGTSRAALETAGGSIGTLIVGKLFPYTVLFTAIGLTSDMVMYGLAGFPLAGQIWGIFLGTFAMILASEAVGIFIIGMLPVLRLATSIAALYSVLGFSLAGFTFPVEAMPPYIQGLAAAFPLRHYYEIYVQEAIFARGFGAWSGDMGAMMIFLLLPAIVYERLESAYRLQNFPKK